DTFTGLGIKHPEHLMERLVFKIPFDVSRAEYNPSNPLLKTRKRDDFPKHKFIKHIIVWGQLMVESTKSSTKRQYGLYNFAQFIGVYTDILYNIFQLDLTGYTAVPIIGGPLAPGI